MSALQTFDARTMPLNGLRLIEASAGTGKTFSLASLFLRLLLQENLSVGDILVVTFTRAATQELRERIRQRLRDAARLARAPELADPDRAEDQLLLALLPRDNHLRAAARLADAAQRMDEATITTIHGFAQSAARDHAFAGRLPFDRGDPVNEMTLLEEAATDYWRDQVIGGKTPGLQALWSTPDQLFQLLKSLWNRPDLHIAGPATGEIAAAWDDLRACWSQDAEGFRAAWLAAERDGLIKISADWYKPLRKHGGIPAALDSLDSAMLQPGNLPVLASCWALPDGAAQIFKKAHTQTGEALLDSPLARALRRYAPMGQLQALRTAIVRIRALITRRKRERQLFSFDDLITSLDHALQAADTGPALADAMHRTWPWALIDEFQDTDPAQYRIFDAIYRDRERGGLMLIGDPKQAIYGFRGGDIHAYLAAAEQARDQRYSLDRNFRSTPALLQAIDCLFSTPAADPFLFAGIPFTAVRSGKNAHDQLLRDGKPHPALEIWTEAPEKTSKTDVETRLQAACVSKVQALLAPDSGTRIQPAGSATTRAVQASDIAILVNSNRQAAQVQTALSQAGVASVCVQQASVFASAQALCLHQVLDAIAHPADEMRLRGALLSELFGLQLGELQQRSGDAALWTREIAHFQALHGCWLEHGVLAVVQRLLHHACGHLASRPDGERRISNFLQLGELLAAAEASSFGLRGLLDHLARRISEADTTQTQEDEQLRLESDAALVRILTIHKAKGLEFNLVLLPFAPWLGSQGKPDQPPFRYHDGHRQTVELRDLPAARAAAVGEQRAESLRLLYVALTRARLGLFMPWLAANGTANSALASLLQRDLIPAGRWFGGRSPEPLSAEGTAEALAHLCQRAAGEMVLTPLPAAPDAPPAPGNAGQVIGQPRHERPADRTPWSVTSFSYLARLSPQAEARPGAADEPLPALPDPVPAKLPRGPAFGSAIHELLEHGLRDHWWELPAAEQGRRLREAMTQFGFSSLPPNDDDPVNVACRQLVTQSLCHPLPGIGPLAELPDEHWRAELEFHLSTPHGSLGELRRLLGEHGYCRNWRPDPRSLHGLLHGYIDLIARDHEGRFVVIDYKTNDLGPDIEHYATARLGHAIAAHHYDLQYLIYCCALHRFLRQRLPDYRPEQHLGGVQYLFLRGLSSEQPEHGIFIDRPPPQLIEQLDAALGGRTVA